MSKRKKRGRLVNGVIVLNKPAGITSNRALQRTRGILGAQKAGHTGTLDPFATGVLPICFGEATKFSRYLLDSDKEYIATVKLGVKTNTGDLDGECIESRPVPALTLHDLRFHAEKFEGSIEQIPPMYSALKYQGQPLYSLARKGINVERKSRSIHVFFQRIETFDALSNTFEWRVRCSKGTYIRTLVEDLGAQIGCGAHVQALKRATVGLFSLEDSVEMDDLQRLHETGNLSELDGMVSPLSILFKGWRQVVLPAHLCQKMQLGQSVSPSIDLCLDQPVCVLSPLGEVIGVAEVGLNGDLKPQRMVSTMPSV